MNNDLLAGEVGGDNDGAAETLASRSRRVRPNEKWSLPI